MIVNSPVPQIETTDETPVWLIAVRAAESKKAENVMVLDLREATTFTDHFVIATGANARQLQAMADEIHFAIKQEVGQLPLSFEGYNNAEWVLLDYGDFLVHLFSETARRYYDLERLWRGAKQVEIPRPISLPVPADAAPQA